MQELVVPKSIPKTLAIIENSFLIPSSPTDGVAVAKRLVKHLTLQQALGQSHRRSLSRSLRGTTVYYMVYGSCQTEPIRLDSSLVHIRGRANAAHFL